jgi:hypothetical protein
VARIGDGGSGGAPAADRGAGSLVRLVQATEKMTWGKEYSVINKCVTRERTEGGRVPSPAMESSGGDEMQRRRRW